MESVIQDPGPVWPIPLKPMRRQAEFIRHLQTREAELWKWFGADRIRRQNNEAVRLDLLKTTYRIEREADGRVYALADEVALALGLEFPITLYQSSGGGTLNAALAYMPREAHVVLAGPILSALTPMQIKCVLAHELMHFMLMDLWPDHLIAVQLLSALCNDSESHPAHHASARLMRLYAEVLCDRSAYFVTRDLNAVVETLVKIETQAPEASAESYLRQADEIFAKGHPASQGVTHPETFIRAKALRLWAADAEKAEPAIEKIIEGPLDIETLDLLGQQTVSGLTRRLVAGFLSEKWLQTDAMLAHARLFFEDFKPGEPDAALANDLDGISGKLRDYFVYVLLDFATADRDLEDSPLAVALLLSDDLRLGDRFRELATRELNLRKKQLQTLDDEAVGIVAKAREGTD